MSAVARRAPLAAALAAAALLAAAVFAVVPLRSDLTDLLPEGGTDAARLMLGELRSGSAASLILAGVQGASDRTPEAAVAEVSDRLAQALAQDPRFDFARNGRQVADEAEIDALFARRYLLSPAASPAAFEVPALRRDFETLLEGLRSSASPAVQRYGMPDPTGAFPALVAAWIGDSRLRTSGGVWMAPAAPGRPPRALLLVETRAAGTDLAGQGEAVAAIRTAFETARGGASAELLLAGPAVFAQAASAAIRDDVRLISVASAASVAGLLLWRFRSAWVLAAVAVPLLLGTAAAAAAVGLRFGFVHGVTLGFGMTMLGVTVDYPVLLIGHRKAGEPASGTLARIGATFATAVATAAIGLSGMIFAGAPGVAQLGLFSVAGLLGAAAATRFLLPRLIVAAGLAPVSAGDPALLRRVERWRRLRPAGLAAVAAAALLLALRPPAWQGDLGALTPVPAADLRLDAELREQLGAPDPGVFAVVRGASQEEVLRQEERLQPAFDRLAAEGAIGGVEMAAALLPSAERQIARRDALPRSAELATRVALASGGMGFSAAAFQPFEADVAAARTSEPLRPEDVTDKLLAARLGALMAPRDGAWIGLIVPRGLRDPGRFAAAASAAGAVVVDVGRETRALADGWIRSAWPLLAGGAAACLACLAVALRDPVRVLRVAASVAASLLVTVAILSAAGAKLTVIHLVALQFTAGVGLDYALFFARAQVDEEERARTLRTLVTCVCMALLTFGMLALCRTPLLQSIGATVAVGVAASMVLAFLFAGPKLSA